MSSIYYYETLIHYFQSQNIDSKVKIRSFTGSPACYVLPYRRRCNIRDIILQIQLKVLRINYRILKQDLMILPTGKA